MALPPPIHVRHLTANRTCFVSGSGYVIGTLIFESRGSASYVINAPLAPRLARTFKPQTYVENGFHL
jgi:hypothetical protein